MLIPTKPTKCFKTSQIRIFLHQIDYPDVQLMRPGQRQSCTTMNLEKLLALEQEEVSIALDARQRYAAEDDTYTHHHRLQVGLITLCCLNDLYISF